MPAGRVVAEEDDGRLPGQTGKPCACRGQLITPDRDKDDVVVPAGVRYYGGSRAGPPTAEDIPGGKASGSYFISPRPMAQHRDRVPRCREVRTVDGSDRPGGLLRIEQILLRHQEALRLCDHVETVRVEQRVTPPLTLIAIAVIGWETLTWPRRATTWE